MNVLRRTTTTRLVAVVAALVALAVAATIAVASRGGGPKPPPRPLAVALHRALEAKPPAGITARIRFTDHLLPSGSLAGVAGTPLLSGAAGRLWLNGDGHFRLELQSDAGDAQIVYDGRALSVYDAATQNVFRLPLPHREAHAGHVHHVPSLAAIRSLLHELAGQLTLSGAIPQSIAGRPAYGVRISPKHDGGLLGAVEAAWDAGNGVPLRVAVLAHGDRSPVLELTATDIAYGPVPSSDIALRPPAGAHVTTLALPSPGELHGGAHPRAASPATLSFRPIAPKALVGLPRTAERGVRIGSKDALLAVYGKGLGALVVLERGADGSPPALPLLPRVSIDGATGSELATALGTVLVFQRNGVAFTVLGSLPPAAAEAAARGLVR